MGEGQLERVTSKKKILLYGRPYCFSSQNSVSCCNLSFDKTQCDGIVMVGPSALEPILFGNVCNGKRRSVTCGQVPA
eukprot:scaffold2897_cov178-Amphora_coffeaeformis.AAC.18